MEKVPRGCFGFRRMRPACGSMGPQAMRMRPAKARMGPHPARMGASRHPMRLRGAAWARMAPAWGRMRSHAREMHDPHAQGTRNNHSLAPWPACRQSQARSSAAAARARRQPPPPGENGPAGAHTQSRERRAPSCMPLRSCTRRACARLHASGSRRQLRTRRPLNKFN